MCSIRQFAVLCSSLLAAACTVGGAAIEPMEDRVVAVGEELLIEVRGSSPRGDPLAYTFTSNHPFLAMEATVSRRPDGSGLFRWVPRARDIGSWVIDFTASDEGSAASESIQIEVRSALGANTIPLFRRPVGAGTAVDLTQTECVELAIEASDQDSLKVTIAEEEPRIEGAELEQDGDMGATWTWCPSPEQRELHDRYLLTLSADDGDNPKAIKRYQIILREQPKTVCGGGAPSIAHAPEDRSTVNDLEVVAAISDDNGLKAAPLLYYSSQPFDDPTQGRPTQVNMQLVSGDQHDGTWRATIPNPVARDPSGSAQTIHYALVAEDADDGLGDCSHVVIAHFTMRVASPGGDGELELCSPCTADNQCGGPADHCLRVGVEGAAFCMSGCAGDGDCPAGTTCSSAELESLEGARGRQCVPDGETCLEQAGVCRNDDLENNDSREAAQPLGPGTTAELALCPIGDFGGEDDWYRIELVGESELVVALDGAAEPDMDLDLVDEQGALVALTWAAGSQDRLAACLPAGTYYLRAFSWFAGENRYAIRWTAAPAGCQEEEDWWATCWDDLAEEDDGIGGARWVDLDQGSYRDAGNQICSGDDDWYQLTLYAGETLHATLDFAVTGPGQDLDLHVHDAAGADLTPCSTEEPWECSANGQSGGSGERMAWTAPAGGTYFLVVRGWDGGENGYDLCAALADGDCP